VATWRKVRPLRTLDFDCENRPLSYLGGDFTTPELTAVAYQFIGEKDSDDVWVLGEDTLLSILHGFRGAWDQADMVTGHNIRKHDLRLVNAMLLEARLPPLGCKLVCDTYRDLKTRSPGFASQATLASMLGVRSPKVGMSQADWREANRLTPEGIEKTRRRVIGDVRQHIQLRKELLRRDWLRPPRMWQP
jgi:hypothetical protein